MSRTFEQIFEYIQTTDVTYCVVRASYLEIYNEEIRDLLHKNNRHKLVVKEHPEKGIQNTWGRIYTKTFSGLFRCA